MTVSSRWATFFILASSTIKFKKLFLIVIINSLKSRLTFNYLFDFIFKHTCSIVIISFLILFLCAVKETFLSTRIYLLLKILLFFYLDKKYSGKISCLKNHYIKTSNSTLKLVLIWNQIKLYQT